MITIWIKNNLEKTKNIPYEDSSLPRTIRTLKAGKYNNDNNLLLHKHKDGCAQWILRYILQTSDGVKWIREP